MWATYKLDKALWRPYDIAWYFRDRQDGTLRANVPKFGIVRHKFIYDVVHGPLVVAKTLQPEQCNRMIVEGLASGSACVIFYPFHSLVIRGAACFLTYSGFFCLDLP